MSPPGGTASKKSPATRRQRAVRSAAPVSSAAPPRHHPSPSAPSPTTPGSEPFPPSTARSAATSAPRRRMCGRRAPSVQPDPHAREAAELGRIAHDIDVAEGAAGVKAEGDRGADGVALVENQAEAAVDFTPHLAPRRPGAAEDAGHEATQIGRASCRAGGGQYV